MALFKVFTSGRAVNPGPLPYFSPEDFAHLGTHTGNSL
jgi:hypothetical protein